MSVGDEEGVPVKAKALLIAPASLDVVWMNESAAEVVPGLEPADVRIEQVVPSAEGLGVAAAVADVARSGIPRHLGTNLVSTLRGSLAVVMSLYRMPDGHVLLLMDEGFTPTYRRRDEATGRPRRRGRTS